MVRKDVLPHVAAALQAKVRPIEKAERKAKDEAAKAAREVGDGMTTDEMIARAERLEAFARAARAEGVVRGPGGAEDAEAAARILANRPYRKREDREAAQIECPECQAPAEHHCVTRWGNSRAPHPARRRARAANRDIPAVSS